MYEVLFTKQSSTLVLKFLLTYHGLLYNRLYRLIINNGIISVQAYSLYCHEGTILTLFKDVRYIK